MDHSLNRASCAVFSLTSTPVQYIYIYIQMYTIAVQPEVLLVILLLFTVLPVVEINQRILFIIASSSSTWIHRCIYIDVTIVAAAAVFVLQCCSHVLQRCSHVLQCCSHVLQCCRRVHQSHCSILQDMLSHCSVVQRTGTIRIL